MWQVRLVSAFIFLGCLALLGLGAFPGLFDWILWLVVVAVAVACAGLGPVLVIVGLLRRRRARHTFRDRFRVLRPALIAAALTVVLLRFHIPLKVAFRLSRSSLAQLAEAATPQREPTELVPVRCGLFRCDSVATDPRGGVYIRTFQHPDGPDTMSYGFAHQPNAKGSPFGADEYRLTKLGAGWYVFRASDDHY